MIYFPGYVIPIMLILYVCQQDNFRKHRHYIAHPVIHIL